MLPSEPGPAESGTPGASGYEAAGEDGTARGRPEASDAALRDAATETVRLRTLSWPSRLVVALAIGGLAVYATVHLAMIFLYVAPSNTVREQAEGARDYVLPEFEQNWKLFAPNPLQRNVAVEVRVETSEPVGGVRVSDWISLTAMDIENIEGSLLPSHADQNILRRGWDFLTGAHTDEGEPIGLRGELSEAYLRRIALLRLSDTMDVTTVERVQFREARTRVPAPDWRSEDFDTSTTYLPMDWWTVEPEDLPADVRDDAAEDAS
ncbi:DUF5819 family protein [Streptomyces avicenniae]|uniref:DUF5819 family protein n=1 Tax=Streptomyces avicenniae TaxID=500153 RepID=UPI000A6B9AE0|nr:DUF5819 family protein [Streptomyces avicenniae]